MSRRKTSSDSVGTARYAQGAILALGFFVLSMSFTAVFVVRSTVRMQEESISASLQSVARAVAEPWRAPFLLLGALVSPDTGDLNEEALLYWSGSSAETSSPSEDWKSLAISLQAAESLSFVRDAHLLTPSGQVIMNSAGEVLPAGERDQFALVDAETIASAAAGNPASPAISARDLNKRLYFPLRDSEGHEVIAIVRVAADPVGFEELRRKGRNVLLGFIVSNVVLVVLYVMTMRLVRRTIEAERLAAQADRLRALGTMTAGIAHEIRNPLGIISLQVEEMRAFLPQIPEEKTRAAFDEIAHDLQAETKRLRELTESFLHFSKASSSTSFQPVSVRVDKILEPLLKIWTKGLNPELRKISYRNPDPDARVLFTEDRLRQVVLNLLRNADEAMGSRQGSIEITVRTGGNYVDIVIQDTGPGIPKENIEQIFDPFFTTRVEGTGLGLPLSRAMARSAKGDILVESEPGKGSTFTLRLHGR